MKWLKQMHELARSAKPFALVTVIEITGSAPREVGARIVVTESETYDSIGGGKLEFEAIARARQMLCDKEHATRMTEYFGLGVTMSQCCGGAVRLLFETFSKKDCKCLNKQLDAIGSRQFAMLASRLTDDSAIEIFRVKRDPDRLPAFVTAAASKLLEKSEPRSVLVSDQDQQWFITRVDEQPSELVLFGAGHVGKALVKQLEDLPFHIQWIDQRENVFSEKVPPNTKVRRLDDPLLALENQSPDAFYAVMTHSHGLDYKICLNILRRRQFAWLGLIGSQTKRQRFIKRFAEDGLEPFILQRLHCPIGLPEVKGKMPAAIALSSAAQLLQAHHLREQQVVSNSPFLDPSMQNASAIV